MKVEMRRKLIRETKKANDIYKRIKKRNKKTKLSLICITNLMKKFPDLDVEMLVDSSQDYDYNFGVLNNMGGIVETTDYDKS